MGLFKPLTVFPLFLRGSRVLNSSSTLIKRTSLSGTGGPLATIVSGIAEAVAGRVEGPLESMRSVACFVSSNQSEDSLATTNKLYWSPPLASQNLGHLMSLGPVDSGPTNITDSGRSYRLTVSASSIKDEVGHEREQRKPPPGASVGHWGDKRCIRCYGVKGRDGDLFNQLVATLAAYERSGHKRRHGPFSHTSYLRYPLYTRPGYAQPVNSDSRLFGHNLASCPSSLTPPTSARLARVCNVGPVPISLHGRGDIGLELYSNSSARSLHLTFKEFRLLVAGTFPKRPSVRTTTVQTCPEGDEGLSPTPNCHTV
ncbi:hypothetical protein BSL78_07421 [Apostichopus japonicus]|uniref:Uncharacterized protein n=1 Tax=Stichopus japonicus TaxID=307972 RepID=A0A2G8L604_STIJA|nr:hypothetical protein BSL78_07421 [Apostichopus japonicus]